MTSFVPLLLAIGARWAVITTIAHARRGDAYDAEALQVYNRRAPGGICRDRAGRNPRAHSACARPPPRCTGVHCRR
ncbi:hypothetical protein J7E87_26585 [Streptomyces sp. ISL-1]|uniref:hypothetical protein n=1 Tax=Streptomyces sp. ISL-1 TaxID=2817657 RepID=UPI001BEA83C0|nr:hypothetical protein [Streptomyces sp. ISL-1]MBT2392907.1 hypothetical protein [Streptomyces sp. ISL-1]